MELYYGIEWKATGIPYEFVDDVYEIIYHFPITDINDQFVLLSSSQARDALMECLVPFSIIEDTALFYSIEFAQSTDLLADYGWGGNRTNLFYDLTIPFAIEAGDPVQIKMAMFQMEEHIIASCKQTGVLFVDRHNQPLIKKYSSAYEINVKFFEAKD